MPGRDRWLLPDGVDEVLPPHAEYLEDLRRQVLDLLRRWGYRFVMPPLIEYLESLLSGIGEDLELQTFKLTDQLSGRLMGIRADITPQAARIDAHRLATDFPQRLCYLGPVLHTVPGNFAGSRNPLQIGAELYGHSGIESDAEVLCLLIEVLRLAGFAELTIELGHMGVFRALADAARLDIDIEQRLLDCLLRKAEDEVIQCLIEAGTDSQRSDPLASLLQLNGGVEVIQQAATVLREAPDSVAVDIAALGELIEMVQGRNPDVAIHVDLAELRGYRYHTGIIFAAYTPGIGRAIAWGGRYDNIGREFGRARPATGFSADLKRLVTVNYAASATADAIYAPSGSSPDLIGEIERYRKAGEIVIQALAGQAGGAADLGCGRELVKDGRRWMLVTVGH